VSHVGLDIAVQPDAILAGDQDLARGQVLEASGVLGVDVLREVNLPAQAVIESQFRGNTPSILDVGEQPAVAFSECSVTKLEKTLVLSLLHEEPSFAELFLAHLFSRSIRLEEDLVDQLFNSSEKRLVRVLLLLANFGKEGAPRPVIPMISQGTLAGIVGTTRPRVNFFMNRFRKLGFVEYNGSLKIHSSLLNVVLHD
jgi:hypothetical protein